MDISAKRWLKNEMKQFGALHAKPASARDAS